MGAFSSLSEKLSHVFSKMKNKGKLTDLEVKQAMREIRIALLEADVNFDVVKKFINTVSEKASGEDILAGLNPTQQVIKIVNEELTALMGGTNSKIEIAPKPPTIILMCGLQGSGKTTMCGKLGFMLRKQGKKPLLVACDIYRPAAIKQLQVVGHTAGVPVFEMGQIDPQKIVKEALKEAEKNQNDIVIVDTAGRLQIDEKLMDEIAGLKKTFNPNEILLVVDSMTGQDAVNVAQKFNEVMDVTGVVLTKLDGDTRGGAALSIRAVTGKPIKFCGIGEKISDLEIFYPDRMASRILGMGDVLTIIEKAQSAYTEKEALEMQKKFKENTFTLDDYLVQFEKMKSMGNMQQMLQMVPGLAQRVKGDIEIDEKQLDRTKAIILSMTKKERENPDLIKSSNKKRIAAGSGTSIQDVNQLLKQFSQMREMMNRIQTMCKRGFMGGMGGRFPF